ncbi:hypothetical protein SLEP1_g9790 [Rubroshorea leprosula]|uniref:Uncharacterized protein n=1 Tax=Rubroshorea leprosula TaxID=152421 RepID=A0AAV5IAI8_9ROSI|nr:hypothetical protein SLEP1_g9790 [Rubroshorea leprosula]
MSILQYPDAFRAPELQIWENAAFDNGESEDSSAIKGSWCNVEAVLLNRSLESDGSKENQSPESQKSLFSLKSSTPFKSLCPNNAIGNLEKPSKRVIESRPAKSKTVVGKDEDKKRDERKIDMEIEEIEKEISRLSTKLEALRFEKAEQTARNMTMKGRIVPAKFMEHKQSVKNSDAVKRFEDPLFSNSRTKLNRRGVSLGPSEIYSATKSRQSMKQEFATPVPSTQNRRKSCFFKLQDIDEGKVTRERGKSLSLSPKSRRTVSKVQAAKQAATTVGSKRSMKKEDGVLASIQPKKLFGEKSASVKKPLKPGRIVASRYSQNVTQNDARKRSLPDNDKEERSRCEKRRISGEKASNSCHTRKSESRMKKRWEIPTEVVVFNGEVEAESPRTETKVGSLLPKIRTLRCIAESPRDSGPAKRVVELMGKRSYFCIDEETEVSVCQSLSFAEEDAEEEC